MGVVTLPVLLLELLESRQKVHDLVLVVRLSCIVDVMIRFNRRLAFIYTFNLVIRIVLLDLQLEVAVVLAVLEALFRFLVDTVNALHLDWGVL